MVSLTSLDLSFNQIRNEGASAIANSQHMVSLTSLNLNVNEIRDDVK